MHATFPPLVMSGPNEPHALDGLPVMHRPQSCDVVCDTCHGRGAWNAELHLDSQRCRLAICGDCDGYGWKASDGSRTFPDITYVDGHPVWIVRRVPAPPVLVSVQEVVPESAPIPDVAGVLHLDAEPERDAA